MNKEKRLQRESHKHVENILDQENFVEKIVQSITEREFANHAELRNLVEEAQDSLDALEQDWAKAEEARDKLKKLQGERKEVR